MTRRSELYRQGADYGTELEIGDRFKQQETKRRSLGLFGLSRKFS